MVRLDGGNVLMSCRVCRVVEGTQRQAEVGPLWREIGGQEDVRGALSTTTARRLTVRGVCGAG